MLGGSVGLAAKQRGVAGRVCGLVRREESIAECLAAGVVDDATLDVAEAVADADLVILCTPVGRMGELAAALKPHLAADAIVTDVGSVKEIVCNAASLGLPDGVRFVGSHPLAGSEKNGFEFSDATLFEGRATIVTPLNSSQNEAADEVTAFWQSLGSIVHRLDVESHDRALAMTSHLPHVAAAALASLLTEDLRPLAATGFRDTTRVAAGDPDLWVSILLSNAGAIAGSLDEFSRQFDEFREAVRNHDGERLKTLLQLAKTNRDALD